jgi:putative addiction module component (TIGR02574 family)
MEKSQMKNNLAYCEELAFKLSVNERAILAEHLIRSLDDIDEEDVERAWLEEADRRYQAYKAGDISSRPSEEVFRDARARLR